MLACPGTGGTRLPSSSAEPADSAGNQRIHGGSGPPSCVRSPAASAYLLRAQIRRPRAPSFGKPARRRGRPGMESTRSLRRGRPPPGRQPGPDADAPSGDRHHGQDARAPAGRALRLHVLRHAPAVRGRVAAAGGVLPARARLGTAGIQRRLLGGRARADRRRPGPRGTQAQRRPAQRHPQRPDPARPGRDAPRARPGARHRTGRTAVPHLPRRRLPAIDLMECPPESTRTGHPRAACMERGSRRHLNAVSSGQGDGHDVEAGDALEVADVGCSDAPSGGDGSGRDEPVVRSDVQPGCC